MARQLRARGVGVAPAHPAPAGRRARDGHPRRPRHRLAGERVRRHRLGDVRRKDSGRAGYMGGGAKREGMYDIIPEVAPIEGEVFLKKTSPSRVLGTPVTGHLTALGVDTIIVAGREHQRMRPERPSSTPARTATRSLSRGMRVRPPRAPHAINLFDMNQKYADVMALDEIIEWMHEWQAPEGLRRL